ncbi:protein tyrosine phosphatase family protein [Niveibacterium terrae]|uniref:protein tyrosine phosphatase family protein n=1 Tax=Niveibacterium terrae TaxID=3373598 RepID=UPI003A9152B2
MDAENTYQVFDWLWSSGQLSARDIAELPLLGIEWVINLAPPTSSNALEGEAERVSALGMGYLQLPVPWTVPESRHFAQFAALLGALSGRRVWVHCARNMRASTFIHLYRLLVLGDSEEKAGFPMHQVWKPDEVWQTFIDKVRAER